MPSDPPARRPHLRRAGEDDTPQGEVRAAPPEGGLMFDLWDTLPQTWNRAGHKALERLREPGVVIVDTRDEATVERVARALHATDNDPDDWDIVLPAYQDVHRDEARAVLAVLAKGGD